MGISIKLAPQLGNLEQKKEILSSVQGFLAKYGSFVGDGLVKLSFRKSNAKNLVKASIKLAGSQGFYFAHGAGYAWQESLNQALARIKTQVVKKRDISKNKAMKSFFAEEVIFT